MLLKAREVDCILAVDVRRLRPKMEVCLLSVQIFFWIHLLLCDIGHLELHQPVCIELK